MVQVENEVGLLGAARDHSPLAEAAFAQAVPAELMSYLSDHKSDLIPEFKKYWEAAGLKTAGTWTEVFGDGADEAFMAWHMARYRRQGRRRRQGRVCPAHVRQRLAGSE